EIWFHIHSLMPMEDSARAACVSRTFLRSWRHHPYLILSKETLGLKPNASGKGDVWAFTTKMDLILKNHSSAGVKTLELDVCECRDLNPCYLNDWLQIAITPRIESLTLVLPSKYEEEYNFPCSLLFGVNGNLIRHLHLTYCAFRPTVGAGCLRSLTKLHLSSVRITGEELGMLEMIESKAPNLSTFNFTGDNLVQLSLESLQVKNLDMDCLDEINFLNYSITKLPYMVPNLETLTLSSYNEMVNTPTVAAKFHHLKYLEIYLDRCLSPEYDFWSLASFLDASPILETFILINSMESEPVFEDASNMRQRPEHKYESLKDVMIFGFCSAKSMVELTCHILQNATSLESITLDTINDQDDEDNLGRCSLTPARKTGECCYLSNGMILEANKGLMAIQKYIAAKVPSTVELDVRGPCSRCHTLETR
uniref:At1g61320/AtMIF1 LRR domain-containing protein n=1 Tax=Setaria italica TaxID=4555 RepID=K3YYE2_SETIT